MGFFNFLQGKKSLSSLPWTVVRCSILAALFGSRIWIFGCSYSIRSSCNRTLGTWSLCEGTRLMMFRMLRSPCDIPSSSSKTLRCALKRHQRKNSTTEAWTPHQTAEYEIQFCRVKEKRRLNIWMLPNFHIFSNKNVQMKVMYIVSWKFQLF